MLFQAIKSGDAENIRQMLLEDKSLVTQKQRDPEVRFDPMVEVDAYKFIGAYLGNMTPLQYAIVLGQDAIAKDILERSFDENIDETCGGGNTALHLGIIVSCSNVTRCSRSGKGFTRKRSQSKVE